MSTTTSPLRFGVIGIDHRHIYHLIQGLLDAGASCAGYVPHTSDPKVLQGVQERFGGVRACADPDELLQDPQVQHLGVTETLDTPHGPKHYITQAVILSRTPAEVRTHAPGWGEHTDAVLTDIGYSSTEIAQFHAQGVV